MNADLLKGKRVRWSYDDGPMAGKAFEHSFADDGTVTWREFDGKAGLPAGGDTGVSYEVAEVNDAVYAVSYLARSGWTLTTVVDRKARKIVSFASNEKQLVIQHGKLT